MKTLLKSTLIAAVLATAGFAAFSHTPGEGGPGHMMGGEALKTQLKLTAAQDGAWTAFKAAMQPSADMLARHAQRDELTKLPTLERMEKMKALRTQHLTDMSTAMDKRFDATKTFYTALSPEQQKIFDTSAMPGMGRGGHMGGGWGRHGPGPAQPKL